MCAIALLAFVKSCLQTCYYIFNLYLRCYLSGNSPNYGGTISISAEDCNEQVLFKVKDTGIGIPPERLGLLFDKTSDYTSFGTAGEKGIGLGLDLSFDFVEKHGGKIWVESIVGEGSTFYFTIPQKKERGTL